MTVKDLKELIEKIDENLEVFIDLSTSECRFGCAGSVSTYTRKYELPSGRWAFTTKCVIGE